MALLLLLYAHGHDGAARGRTLQPRRQWAPVLLKPLLRVPLLLLLPGMRHAAGCCRWWPSLWKGAGAGAGHCSPLCCHLPPAGLSRQGKRWVAGRIWPQLVPARLASQVRTWAASCRTRQMLLLALLPGCLPATLPEFTSCYCRPCLLRTAMQRLPRGPGGCCTCCPSRLPFRLPLGPCLQLPWRGAPLRRPIAERVLRPKVSPSLLHLRLDY